MRLNILVYLKENGQNEKELVDLDEGRKHRPHNSLLIWK